MKDPQKFDEFMTALSLISFALGFVSSLAGAAMPYVKGERKFMFYRYIVEVATSAIAGVVVFLLLKVTDIPEEWIAALTGIASFYGTSVWTACRTSQDHFFGLLKERREEKR